MLQAQSRHAGQTLQNVGGRCVLWHDRPRQPALPPTSQQPDPYQAAPAESHPHMLPPQHTQGGMGPSHGGVGTDGLEDTHAPTTWWQRVVAKTATQSSWPPCHAASHCMPWWWACTASTQRAVQCEAILKATCCVCWRLGGRVSCKLICHSHSGNPLCVAGLHWHTFSSGQAGNQSDCCCCAWCESSFGP